MGLRAGGGLVVAGWLGLWACGSPGADDEAWEPDGGLPATVGGGTATGGGLSSTGVGSTLDGTASDPSDDGTADETGEDYDCSPWTTPWIGASCMLDDDCAYDGGFCLREDQGFPCGTCSLSCDQFCRDLDGAPGTFCVDGADVGVDSSGHCLSRCSPELLGDNGCRDGYDCAALPRYMEPDTVQGVCVPGGTWKPMTDCQQDLLDRGVAFVATTHELDHPDGFPELDCVIDDPVLLYSPVAGVVLRGGGGTTNPVLVGCETAHAIVSTAEIAAQMRPRAAQEIIHYGTYSCRVVAGTSTLSNHAEGRAIDIAAFILDDGEQITLFNDWEDGVAMPVTPGGQWLRGFADMLWDTMTWNVILTPEYNDDHDDHFHVDLTPGSMFYE